MKKILAAITSIALFASLSSLTGCVYTEKTSDGGNSQNSESSETGSVNSSQNSETNSDIQQSEPQNSDNSETNSEPKTESRTEQTDFDLRSTDEGFKEKLALFSWSDIELPNGEVLKKEDADFVHCFGDRVLYIGYDSVYMYKAKPYYRNTTDEPDMINWETLEVKDDPGEFTDHEYFKVKPGDTLDNGLTVRSAEYWYGYVTNENAVDLSFDGELTLEGILYRTPEDEYGSSKGTLHFFPDTTKNDFFCPFELYGTVPYLFVDNVNKLAVNYDSRDIRLGNESEAPSGVSEILGSSVSAKVKVTITDLRFKTSNLGVIPTAAIKNIVEL